MEEENNKPLLIIIAVTVVVLLSLFFIVKIYPDKNDTPKQQSFTNNMDTEIPSFITARITTSKGDITLRLFDKDAPKTVKNFTKLANEGFYDGVIFHRVISGFMIQGGDPEGTGSGGPGYTFEDELDEKTPSYQQGYKRGVLAMANAGPNTNGSQFFIMHQDYSLPHDYTIFGQVEDGMDVVDAIAEAETDQNDRPTEPVVIERVTIISD